MGNIERWAKAVEAVEGFLHDTFEAPVAMGEEWTADQADAIVDLVLELTQPRGAVEAERERIIALIRREANETFDMALDHELRTLADRIADGGQ